MDDLETETDSSALNVSRDEDAERIISSSPSSTDSDGDTYDVILSQFLKDMKRVEEADKVDLERQEKNAKNMKEHLEKKKAKVLAKLEASRLDVGQRVREAPPPKTPRQELARDNYMAALDDAHANKEKLAEKKRKELDFRIELVNERIQKCRRKSDQLIADLQKQENIQQAAARERQENAERMENLDRETLEANLAQGVSPPVSMPAADRVREQERTIRQAQLLKEINDTKEKYRLYVEKIELERSEESAMRRAKRARRDQAILEGEEVVADDESDGGGGPTRVDAHPASKVGKKQRKGRGKKEKCGGMYS